MPLRPTPVSSQYHLLHPLTIKEAEFAPRQYPFLGSFTEVPLKVQLSMETMVTTLGDDLAGLYEVRWDEALWGSLSIRLSASRTWPECRGSFSEGFYGISCLIKTRWMEEKT